MRIAIAYIATAVVLLVLDGAWLGTIGGSLFKNTLGDVMAPRFNVAAAAVFYLLYVVGILYFAVLPGIDGGTWTTALTRGALFGFFCYMTYDLTNLATLRNYTLTLALTDAAWGTVVTAASAALGTVITQWAAARFA